MAESRGQGESPYNVAPDFSYDEKAGNDDWEEMLAGEDAELDRRAGRPVRGLRRDVAEHGIGWRTALVILQCLGQVGGKMPL